MVIIIDNYDSFVHNLARYVGQLGYERQVFRNNEITIAEIQAFAPSHLILSPGPCAPIQAGICLEVIRHFYRTIPILGVCLGHQAISEAFGGRVVQARVPIHGKSALINHQQQGILSGLNSPLQVGRYHSLVVDAESLPACLEVTAYSQDREIMALQHQEFPVYGVQFHPESILTEQGYALLQNFLARIDSKKACLDGVVRYDTA
jgi:anthranilate synthase/aminodeoxychorismate synthase-like glutamine amidotransferase